MAAPESPNLSSSSSFFLTYKELFEYEKHVGSEDPVVLSQRDGIGAKTFLDKYKECEQRQVIESRAALQMPLMSTLMVDSMRARGAQIGPTVTPLVFSSSTLTQQQYQHQQLQPEMGHLVTPPQKTSPLSSFTRSKLENSLRWSLSNQEEGAAATASHWAASSSYHHQPRSAQVPEKQASPSKTVVVAAMPVDTSKPLARTLHAAADRIATHFQPPKLTDLLIDSSTRPATLRHRHLDEAKKIELLIGNSCGGRISSVSTNLPPSIRRRLQASTRVEQRREQLYTALRQEYHNLCPHHQ